MLAGFLTAVIWVIAFKEHFYDLYEMIPGFAAGFLATVVVSLLTKPPEGADEEHEAVWRAVGKPFS
jgi:Na+/proline symporter